mmetsp:Transcript_8528/g.14179  ORF Transcript_8528/g.14179 Transcript_8528/m.14179 type:complete len:118 (+) Transcript_8528:377-730(+)
MLFPSSTHQEAIAARRSQAHGARTRDRRMRQRTRPRGCRKPSEPGDELDDELEDQLLPKHLVLGSRISKKHSRSSCRDLSAGCHKAHAVLKRAYGGPWQLHRVGQLACLANSMGREK